MQSGELYINADYIKTGTIIADRLGKSTEAWGTVGKLSGTNQYGFEVQNSNRKMVSLNAQLDINGKDYLTLSGPITLPNGTKSMAMALSSTTDTIAVRSLNSQCQVQVNTNASEVSFVNGGQTYAFGMTTEGFYARKGSSYKWLATF
jgi:hypothetical protein